MKENERIEEMGRTIALLESDLLAANQQLTEKDATIDEQQTEMDRINNHLYKACMDVESLRKALEEAREKLTWNAHESEQIINAALGEGDKQ